MLQRISVLTVMLALTACATDGGSKPGGMPDWVDGSGEAYPRSAYLTGLGSADDVGTARDRARADLAKNFRVVIDERASDLRESLMENGEENYSAELRRDLSVRTEQVLEGVSVPESWRDPMSGRYYAFAVLNRAQAAMRLRQDIAALDAAAEVMLANARRTDDAFDKAGLAIRVVENQRERALLHSTLQAVSPVGGAKAPLWSLAKLEADMRTALARIELRAEGEGAWQRMLAGELADAGFKVKPDGAFAARLDVEVIELPPREGWYWRRAEAVFSIAGPDGEAKGETRKSFKQSATDAATVSLRLREDIAAWLRAESRPLVIGIVKK